MVHLADFSGNTDTFKGFRGDSARDLRQMEAQSGAEFGTNEFAAFFGFPLPNPVKAPVASTNQTPGVLASPLPENTGGNNLATYEIFDNQGRFVAQTTDLAAARSQGFTDIRLRTGDTGDNTGNAQAGGHTYSSILRAFSAGAITPDQAKTELAKLAGWTSEGAGIVIDRVAAGQDPLFSAPSGQPTVDPRAVTPPTRETPARIPTQLDDIPGGENAFQDSLDRQIGLGRGRRGVFDALTNTFTSGLSGVGRAAVGRRFAPLEATFLTDPSLQGVGSNQATSFEDFLGSNPQALGPQALLDRLSNIGRGAGNATGAEADFLDFFTNDRARTLFGNAAISGLNPQFRAARTGNLNREFDQFLFENPESSLIGEIGRRRFR